MNKYEDLLARWCGYLLKMQRPDGGFDCEADDVIHGRADNAVFPFLYEYAATGNAGYLAAAEKLLAFREKFEHPDGSVQNDYTSEWKGITVFSVINLYKALKHFGTAVPTAMKTEIEKRFLSSAAWVYENIRPPFRANVNYYAAAAAADAMAGEYTGRKEYTALAKTLLDYCLGLFTENGLLRGEGQPHAGFSLRGCAPVDIGYNVEESLPCLVDAAVILNDGEALNRLGVYAKKLLEFMLPDGAWDNSFGVRNNKWTYYGSRTSDGCIAAFTVLGRYDPVFYGAAQRTFELLNACTRDGRLYGGRYYPENGQRPCVHHTFCHAAALADALCEGLTNLPDGEKPVLPCDRRGLSCRFYPEINTYKIGTEKWLGTVTLYDYATYTYGNGAAHASGGALSLLYHRDKGPVIAGSVYEYKLTEKNNMQMPDGTVPHAPLIPRAEYEKDGRKYATCLDANARAEISRNGGGITVTATAGFVCAETKSPENEGLTAQFIYRFENDRVNITVTLNGDAGNVRFVLPVIKNTAEVETRCPCEKRDIFFLTGGFAADEYTFALDGTVTVGLF